MLIKIRQLVKRSEGEMVLVISLVLVALISFGLGYLISPKDTQKPIIIYEPTASMIESVSATKTTQALEDTVKTNNAGEQGILVGSVNSNKYHLPSCPSAQKIADKNKVWFESEEEAKLAGYVPCSVCGKNKP